MSATVLLNGKIEHAPEHRISARGKSYVRAILRDTAPDQEIWWKLVCFAEGVRDELASLRAGDGVSATGSMAARLYEKDGHSRVSLTCFVDRILSVHQRPLDDDGRDRG